MTTKLVKLKDGTLVQIESADAQAEPISSVAERVDGAIDDIKPLILKVCKPLRSVWNEMSKDMEIDHAEVELGLGFEAEGNVFVAKGKGSANIKVKFVLKPKPETIPF